MIITKTPFRVSFFGGGTDIPDWFLKEGGQVLSTTIDKFCYVSVRHLPRFFDHSIRLAYSRMETVSTYDEIQHPLIREILRDFRIKDVEVHHDSDLPGRSGLGTSSSFGVGLVTALSGLQGKLCSKKTVADRVIYFEREVLKEKGGWQDQIAAAFGGLNHIVFRKDGAYSVNALPLRPERLKELNDLMLMFYIPLQRFSNEVSVANNIKSNRTVKEKLLFIQNSVEHALEILVGGDLQDLGELLDESWQRKRELEKVTNEVIDDVYAAGIKAGAYGGKLLGAGGGGFILFLCEPSRHEDVKQALGKLLHIPVKLESEGAKIIYYDHTV